MKEHNILTNKNNQNCIGQRALSKSDIFLEDGSTDASLRNKNLTYNQGLFVRWDTMGNSETLERLEFVYRFIFIN
ncbi:hypothetical protein F8M41_005638 [Gigaspora margarita]|uniref:Uncharacterized protein n=1 Tax=Gigaspora margarita TaxID=4874 RepID=A0A8H4A5Z3_GIGMA|nr:hypothetical protein F8M41_005638 [Gigaspora margarita]